MKTGMLLRSLESLPEASVGSDDNDDVDDVVDVLNDVVGESDVAEDAVVVAKLTGPERVVTDDAEEEVIVLLMT